MKAKRGTRKPERKASRAFVTSLLTITIAALIMEFALSIEAFETKATQTQSELFIANYANYYFDDITYDIRVIAGSDLAMSRLDAATLELNFTEPTAAMLFNDSLQKYMDKLANFAPRLNVNITLGASAITGNSLSYYFSNGMLYTVDYGASESDLISSQYGDITNYTVHFSTSLIRESLADFNTSPSGDVYIRMEYRDGNGTLLSEGYIESTPYKQFAANYSGGGKFMMLLHNSSGNPSSYSMSKDGINPSSISVSALVAGNGSEVRITLPITLNVSHVSYSKYGNITVLRG